MENKKYIVIDFDSTFTRVEALDELCEISLAGLAEKDHNLAEIKRITDLGMEGKISLQDSLEQRIQLLKANKRHLQALIDVLRTKVSKSFQQNAEFLKLYADNIYIISNGFKDFIIPIVTELGIRADHVLANDFVFDENDNIIGYDKTNALCANQGKALKIKSLNLDGEIYVIGDGYTDFEIKQAGVADRFYAFTENVTRNTVVENADHVAPNLDEILHHAGFPTRISYPKNRIKVLLLENIHPEAVRIFQEEGYSVELLKGALNEDELIEKIKDVSILGLRSKTNLTEKVLEHANRLIAVGAFCIGTNQIDLKGCLKRGIVAFNAPYSNTRSVVELAIGELILLYRQTVVKNQKMKAGIWDKSAGNSHEIRGKKLGIVGYGNIGSQLSVLAESLGMEVYYYDIVEKLALGNAKKCSSLHELLSIADVVTLHVDGRASNKNIIGKAEFEAMKHGVTFLNLARGHVVDIDALVEALRSGKVAGAGVDVFPYEPATNDEEFVNDLREFPNVILTPHIGGSTEEAQLNIGQFVPNRIIEYVNSGTTYGSVNFPDIQLPALKNAHRLMHIHENVPGILAKINNKLAENGFNILGQYLKTNESVGYVITDVEKQSDKEAENSLKDIPGTIKYRILY